MRKIQHTIPPLVFDRLLSYWEEMRVGDAWSIGNLRYIAKQNHFKYYLAWREYYSQSSNKRNRILSALTGEAQARANNFQLETSEVNALIKEHDYLRDANLHCGRSKDQLKAKGMMLAKVIRNKGIEIEEKWCVKFVFYMVLGLSWNDIIFESKVFQSLIDRYPQLRIKRSEPDIYNQYAIDIIIYLRKQLVCCIVISGDPMYNQDLVKDTEAIQTKHQLLRVKYEIPIHIIKQQSTDEATTAQAKLYENINQVLNV